MRFLHDKSWSNSSLSAGPSRSSGIVQPGNSRSFNTGQGGLGGPRNLRDGQWQYGRDGGPRHDGPNGRRGFTTYPLVTMVGLSLATGAALGYSLPKAWRYLQPRSLLIRAEEALTGYVRPSQAGELPPATSSTNTFPGTHLPPPPPGPANTFFGSYRPPPPPPPAPLGIPRGGGPRPPNPGWGEGRVHAPIYPRPPVPRVVGMMTEGRNEGGAQNDAVEERFEGQDIRELITYFEGEFRAMKRRLDGMEDILHQILRIPQGGNRHLDPHERRPPHDNYGQRPRDDDSDNDSDDDDSHHPPGARIRRPVTPNAGPIPLPDHLDVARPGLPTIRPIVNVEPEETRGLGPDTAAAPAPGPTPAPAEPDPGHIFAVDQISAGVRELQARYQGVGQPVPDQPIPDQPTQAAPTSATSFTNPDPKYVHTFDELKLTMESLKKQYHEYTTNEVVDAIKEIAETRRGPARAALDGDRRPEDGEAPKPKGKYTKKKTEPKPAPVATPSIDDVQSPSPSEIDDGSEPPSRTSSDSRWTPVPDPGTILTGDAKIFNDALEEGMAAAAARGPAPAAAPRLPPSDTTKEFSEIEIPQTPPPGGRNDNALDDAHAIGMERRRQATLAGQEPRTQMENERPSCRAADEEPEAQPERQNPTFTIIEEPARPISARAQMVRIHLYIPHEENLDDNRRRGHNGLLELEVEARGHAGVIEQVRISGVVWVVKESGGVYVLVEPLV